MRRAPRHDDGRCGNGADGGEVEVPVPSAAVCDGWSPPPGAGGGAVPSADSLGATSTARSAGAGGEVDILYVFCMALAVDYDRDPYTGRYYGRSVRWLIR